MKSTFGAFCRGTRATITRFAPTLRLGRTHPVRALSSRSGTSSRNRSLAGYTIDTRESRFSEGTVASGGPAAAAQAAEEAHRSGAAAAASALRAEPGVVLRLRVRSLRQRPAAQVPHRHGRVHQAGSGDRRGWSHPLAARHRGAV